MATIDAAILAAQPKDATPSEQIMAPGATLPITQATQKQETPKLTPEQEDILKAQEKLLGEEEAKRLREEQEQEAAKSQVVKSGEKAVKSAGKIIHGADVRIGNIPQPGSIAFPLTLLLLCFFILIQVNGFSRLGWLWMVITRNAAVSTTQTVPSLPTPPPGGGAVGSGGSSSGASNSIVDTLIAMPSLPSNGVFRLGDY
jgi:hypothetical protein